MSTQTATPLSDRHIELPPPQPQKKGGSKGVWIGVIVVLLIGAGIYLLVRHMSTAPVATSSRGQRPVPVVSAAARRGDLKIYLEELGTVTSLNSVTVRSRVDGEVMKVDFTEGAMVKQGDPLFQIDPRPFQVQLEQAKGQLARDQAILENAKADLRRYEEAGQGVSQQQIASQAATVKQYEGTILSDQSQIDNAKLQLIYCNVTSPISGKIGLRLVDEGNIVHANDANGLVVVQQIQPISVVFYVSQDDIPAVQRAAAAGPVPIEAWSADKTVKLADGTLLATDNQVDPANASVKLRANFKNENRMLFPGAFVNVKMLVKTEKNVVLVPTAAVQPGPTSQMFVYVVKPDQTVEMRDVKVETTQGELTSIADGLAPGDVVVIDGVDKLTQGSKVIAKRAGGTTRPSFQPTSDAAQGTKPPHSPPSTSAASATTQP